MLLIPAALLFIALLVVGTPIVFCLAISGMLGLSLGNFNLGKLPSSMISTADSFVMLAIPSFVFAGDLMERCGMSYRLIDLARSLVGRMRGGLGMTTVLAEYLFSGISGSSVADVSAIGSMLTPPMLRAGYKPEQAVSIVAASSGMGILVPPCIFMIIVGTMTNTTIVGIFLGGFLPGLLMSVLLMGVIYWQAVRHRWPTDVRPDLRGLLLSTRKALVPLFVPLFMLAGFRFGIFTATEAGAIIAAYALLVAVGIYRNVTLTEIIRVAENSALITAAVVLLMGAAAVYQFLLGMAGVPQMVGDLLAPLRGYPTVFLIVVSVVMLVFGMIMEGPPAAVILLPVLFPAAKAIGINPIHFNIVVTAAVGVGFFLPPLGVGLLIALRFGKVSVTQHFRHYWPYVLALLLGIWLIVLIPEVTLWLPRSAGFR